MRRGWSIRARLTFWYTGVLVCALILQGAAIFFLQQRLARRELDLEVAQDLDTLRHGITQEYGEMRRWPDAVIEALRETVLPERRAAVFCGDTLIAEQPAGASATLGGVDAGTRVSRTRSNEAWRLGAIALDAPAEQGACRIVLGRSMAEVLRLPAVTLDAVWMGLLLTAATAGLGGFWIARRALRPLAQLADECERIPASRVVAPSLDPAADRSGARLTLPGTGDELDRVVESFNGLLGRLDTVLDTQRQFMADASHELRTPVSVVRSAAEIALSRADRDREDYRDTLEIVAAQSRRMSHLVEDLFLLARADAGQRPFVPGRLYLDDLVRESVEALAVLARTRGVTIEPTIEADIEIEGDEHLLRQLVVNVLRNAVVYTRPDTRVTVRLARAAGAAPTGAARVELRIADQGPGVPPGSEARMFERFVRLPAAAASRGPQASMPAIDTASGADSRARLIGEDEEATGGAGLGLAISRAIADLHGGAVTLESSNATGSTFLITLPLPASDPAGGTA